MTAMRYLAAAMLASAVGFTAPPAVARTVGQVIDDTAITAEIKAKLAAEKLSNLTRIEVRTDNGIVTLGGVVEEVERRARAAQIASTVNGVKGLVNNIHVAGETVPPAPQPGTPVAVPPASAPPVANAPPATAPTVSVPPPIVTAPSVPVPPGGIASAPAAPGMIVDTTGIVAHVDHATGTITLQDGRVVRLTPRTVVWQPVPIDSLHAGAQVYVREAAPVAVQLPSSAPEWRMGTVRMVDRTTNQLVLTDGTIVRMPPGAVLRRGKERLAIDQILPGSEVIVRPAPRSATAEGSALPGATTVTTIDAAELNVVWTPVNAVR